MARFKLRKAELGDVDVLAELIKYSATSINSKYYSEEEIDAALGTAWTVDTQLILDETYWLVQSDNQIIGCGGWSKRNLLFGKSDAPVTNESLLDPKIHAAKLRAFFVHPDHVRKGIGRLLLEKCESDALKNGFKSLELVATLSGFKLYEASGYHVVKKYDILVEKGITNAVVDMVKELGNVK